MIFDSLVLYENRRHPISASGSNRHDGIINILKEACLTLDRAAPKYDWARNIAKMRIVELEVRHA